MSGPDLRLGGPPQRPGPQPGHTRYGPVMRVRPGHHPGDPAGQPRTAGFEHRLLTGPAPQQRCLRPRRTCRPCRTALPRTGPAGQIRRVEHPLGQHPRHPQRTHPFDVDTERARRGEARQYGACGVREADVQPWCTLDQRPPRRVPADADPLRCDPQHRRQNEPEQCVRRRVRGLSRSRHPREAGPFRCGQHPYQRRLFACRSVRTGKPDAGARPPGPAHAVRSGQGAPPRPV